MKQAGTDVTEAIAVSDGFRPVESEAPRRDGTLLMVEAYVAIWVVLMFFVVVSGVKMRRLEGRIAKLERVVVERG